jgi:hypothetical protein
MPIGGWCPADGRAEDLREPPGVRTLFPELRPTPSADPAQRTRWNVRDSDATLVLVRGEAESPGTQATVVAAVDLGKPHLVADVQDVAAVRAWLATLPAGTVLNVAGPRESQAPGIEQEVARLLETVFAED